MPILVTPGNFAIGGGFTHAKLKTFGGSVPAGYLLAARSVVVTMTDLSKQGDTLGYSAKIPKNGRYLHNQRIGLVATRVPAKLCIDYAYYLLQTPKYRQHILASATGSTVRHTSPSRIYDFKFDLPPLDEQRRIAEVLGALDDLIDTNERQIRGIRSLTTQLYKTALATSGEREVAFYEVFKVEFGGAFKGEHFTKSGVGMPLLRIRDFKRAVSDVWTTERLPGDTVVTAGDIVVGMDAEFRPNQWAGERSLLNQRVCRVSARNASNAFALEALEAPMAYIEGHKTGTTVIHLNKRDLEETRVTIPSEVAIREFDDVAEPLRVHSIGLSQENKTLRRTRDELLPLLMSGKVRVNPEGVSV
jgi:type I restriction enzyme S subunit